LDHDLNRSAEHIACVEEARARSTGFGTTKQGRAIERQFHEQLAEIIAANREVPDRRERPVWRALKDIKIDDLTLRLLTAGITVCHGNDLGVDDDDQKNFRDIALWIARNLFPTRDRELALKVGVWGINGLCKLPIFELGDDDVLVLVLSDCLDALLDDVLLHAIKTNPLLAPSADPPQPWTQVRRGGLPSGHGHSLRLSAITIRRLRMQPATQSAPVECSPCWTPFTCSRQCHLPSILRCFTF